MDREAGIWVLGVATALFVVVVVLVRPRVPRPVTDALVAMCGGSLAVGALLVQQHVETVEWILTIPAAAALGVANIRALFAGSGPLRI